MRSPRLIGRTRAWIARIELATRPEHPDTTRALQRRWAELPGRARTAGQLLGTRTAGCEGTQGVFPRCNLACTPCYHSRDANRVPTDGEHTVREVERQMVMLRAARGPGQHAQLIGGEVTLLGARDHARALAAMERHGRKPMSMSHGDFDYAYLRDLALDGRGRPRFRLLRFAGHFDSLMLGRRGIRRPRSERDLHPARREFVAQFRRLRREHGVRYDLAHNMTVTPRNLPEVGEVAAECARLGFGMLSFQPAARMGNPARWREDYGAVGIDDVWRQVERGLGTRVPHRPLQMGDERCNRSAYGAMVGGRWRPFFDDRDPRDAAAALRFVEVFGGLDFDGRRALVAARVARALARRPRAIGEGLRWGLRFIRRAGALQLLRGGLRPVTIVVHAFMDAGEVAPAWDAIRRGEVAREPRVRAAQERLAACSYSMAHPETGELVPACVQHAVLDPRQNTRLAGELAARGAP